MSNHLVAFSHLESYNNTEALYQGPTELLTWRSDPIQTVRPLNLEHARLQRLQKTILAHSSAQDQELHETIVPMVSWLWVAV